MSIRALRQGIESAKQDNDVLSLVTATQHWYTAVVERLGWQDIEAVNLELLLQDPETLDELAAITSLTRNDLDKLIDNVELGTVDVVILAEARILVERGLQALDIKHVYALGELFGINPHRRDQTESVDARETFNALKSLSERFKGLGQHSLSVQESTYRGNGISVQEFIEDTDRISRSFLRAIYLKRLRDQDVLWLADQCPNLQSLHLSSALGISDAALECLSRMKHLKSLGLGLSDWYDPISDVGFEHLINAEALETLSLWSSHSEWGPPVEECLSRNRQACGVTDSSLEILMGMPRLKNLFLGKLQRITDTAIGFVSTTKGIRHLSIDCCTGLTVQSAVYLSRMEGLEHLELWCCDWLDDEALEYIARIPRLKTLELHGCFGFTDEGMRHIAANNSIKRLEIDGSNITDRGLECLATMQCLQELELDECSEITEDGVVSLTASNSLQKLGFHSCQLTDALLPRLKGLSAVCADVSCELTGAGLKHLVDLDNLESLVLNCTGVVNDEIVEDLIALGSLCSLGLDDCEGVTDDRLQRLDKALNHPDRRFSCDIFTDDYPGGYYSSPNSS